MAVQPLRSSLCKKGASASGDTHFIAMTTSKSHRETIERSTGAASLPSAGNDSSAHLTHVATFATCLLALSSGRERRKKTQKLGGRIARRSFATRRGTVAARAATLRSHFQVVHGRRLVEHGRREGRVAARRPEVELAADEPKETKSKQIKQRVGTTVLLPPSRNAPLLARPPRRGRAGSQGGRASRWECRLK